GKYMGMERPMRGMGMMAMVSNLGLDEKQTSEFRTLHIEMKKEHIKKKAEISIAELELGEMLAKDPVDMKTAEAKIKQIESFRSDLKMLHIRTHEKVKAMLTPEQRKKLDPYMCMGMGMGTGRDWGMGRGMGMMEKCRMTGTMSGMGQMDWMGQDDGDDMSGSEDMDESKMPDEGNAQ
ncbi:MAG: periplasmic heavy metal sensor, partial [Nitrospiraceae bacterium]